MTDLNLEPVLNIPNAKELSVGGNPTDTTLAESGKLPPFPIPRKNRTTPKPRTDDTKPCNILAIDLQIIMKVYLMRVQSKSIILPTTEYLIK